MDSRKQGESGPRGHAQGDFARGLLPRATRPDRLTSIPARSQGRCRARSLKILATRLVPPLGDEPLVPGSQRLNGPRRGCRHRRGNWTRLRRGGPNWRLPNH
uniref:Uncharacterized protein n=1 Tax=Burkholderia sp. M701 TaxID=326454 RepID=V5YPT6_9BURK|nr:hypothetical protein [Burkholderia sp. M701]